MTIDAVVQERIDEAVKEFVDEGRMFTAFEISLAVKEKGVRERHRNMRGSVHSSGDSPPSDPPSSTPDVNPTRGG